jgi:hypothetical protein
MKQYLSVQVGVAVTLWTCILEALGLNVGPGTGYPDLTIFFRGFLCSLLANTGLQ